MGTTTRPLLIRRQIRVRGIVQGVGFRPFVSNLARDLGLAGYVFNSSAGVTVEIEGTDDATQKFLDALRHRPPPLALISDIAVVELDPIGDDDFVIRQSHAEDGEFVLVSPDMATCDECWRDFGDAENRRFGYPFTNCTNCGPRYTIIQDIPYDRPMTTMSSFRMCERLPGGIRRSDESPLSCPAECLPGVRPGFGDCRIRIGLSQRGGLQPWCICRDHPPGPRTVARRQNRRGEGAGRFSACLQRAGRCDCEAVAHAQTPQRQALRTDGAGSGIRREFLHDLGCGSQRAC